MRYVFLTVSLGVMLGRVANASDEATSNPVTSNVTGLARVRSEDSQIAAVIWRASERSTTLRRLIATIDRTDGLVYVENGKCGHGVRACPCWPFKWPAGFASCTSGLSPNSVIAFSWRRSVTNFSTQSNS